MGTDAYRKIASIALGLLLTVFLLEAGLRLGGFILRSAQEHQNRQSLQQKSTYRIMCVGESTTARQYPLPIEEALNQRHTGIQFSVIDKGVAGANSAVIVAQLEPNLDRYRPDMVVAMMGANDSGAHIPYEAASHSASMRVLRSFRTYKLTRLLWLHILAKARGEGSLKQAVELNPQNDRAYAELGWLYLGEGKLSQAEDAFKKAVELNPQNDRAYAELEWLYRAHGKPSQAEDTLKQAIGMNFKNDRAYIRLGWAYQAQGKLSQAEDAFKKAIELKPQGGHAYAELGGAYQAQGKLSQAEDAFKKAIELSPKSDRAYRALSVLYEEMGKPELAREYAQKATALRSGHDNPVTRGNYRKLKAILDKQGIRLVCVQYPMRSVEPLKRIFEGNEEKAIFVDNEQVFKDAVKKDGYAAYFKDMFGGDFGHCTAKGNRLLAESIADTILKEVFHK